MLWDEVENTRKTIFTMKSNLFSKSSSWDPSSEDCVVKSSRLIVYTALACMTETSNLPLPVPLNNRCLSFLFLEITGESAVKIIM